MITEDEIIKKFGENSTIKYKIISLEQDWRGVSEKWLQIDADTGVITGQPFLSKIGYNEVAGLLSAPEVRSGALLEFDVQSADSLLKALSQDTVFNIEKFTNGLNTALKTLDVYTIEIMSEAVASQNLRLELKQNFNDISASFDENGALIPVTEPIHQQDFAFIGLLTSLVHLDCKALMVLSSLGLNYLHCQNCWQRALIPCKVSTAQ